MITCSNPRTENPKFSVVIPAYNASAYIADGINSVLAQSDQDFEIIVIDDGSTDQTAQIVSAFSDSRIQLVQRSNGGLAAARNTGIAHAQGELVAFLDADDRWCPEKLAAHRRALDQHPEASVSYDWVTFIDSQGQHTGLYATQVQRKLTHNDVIVKNYLVNGSSSVVRRQVLENTGKFDENLQRLVDWELWVRLTYYGHELLLVPQVLTEYRQHSSSLSANTVRMLRGLETFFVQVARYAPESVENFAPLTTACNYRWMARAAFVAGDYSEAQRLASLSLQSSISVLWEDPRAGITFGAIALQKLLPSLIFQRALPFGSYLLNRWFQRRASS